MKQGLVQEINWTHIGALLANADDNDQAECLNSMAKEMLSWDTRHQAEMQVCSLCHKMTDQAKELLDLNYKAGE